MINDELLRVNYYHYHSVVIKNIVKHIEDSIGNERFATLLRAFSFAVSQRVRYVLYKNMHLIRFRKAIRSSRNAVEIRRTDDASADGMNLR